MLIKLVIMNSKIISIFICIHTIWWDNQLDKIHTSQNTIKHAH